MDVHQWKEWIQERSVGMTSPERIQCGLLLEVLHELRMIREATEQANDPDPDAEPDPFQTLNGPSQ